MKKVYFFVLGLLFAIILATTAFIYYSKNIEIKQNNRNTSGEFISIKGRIVDCNNNAIPAKVTLKIKFKQKKKKEMKWETAVYAANGSYSEYYIPTGAEVVVTVRSEDYFNYQNPVQYKIKIPSTQGNNPIYAPTISLPCIDIAIEPEDKDIVWKKNFGGRYTNRFQSILAVSDGIIAVGSGSVDGGDWVGEIGYGGNDAIIVKYDNAGNIVWKNFFGGGGGDQGYNSVTAVPDGIVVVGRYDFSYRHEKTYFNTFIVKYDNAGNVVWKRLFRGKDKDNFIKINNEYFSVTKVYDGIIAVGYSDSTAIAGGTGNALIVKYDNDCNEVWKKNFGGNHYSSVKTVPNGVIAVGSAKEYYFGTGDWTGIAGKGNIDAIIVKYNNNGNVVWKKNFGGNGDDSFMSVTTVSDGIIAVGSSTGSFGTGDWEGVTEKGKTDAIIVKYDNYGNVVWKKNFSGDGYNGGYKSVIAVSDGVIAVGSSTGSFGSGDWAGFTGKGSTDAIIVKYDNNGNVVWKKNFGGNDHDSFMSVTTVSDGIIAVGESGGRSFFHSGDWSGVVAKGSNTDAIIVKYGMIKN